MSPSPSSPRPLRPAGPAGRSRRLALPTILVLVALAGCGDDRAAAPDAPPTIEREAFVETYVGLREAALLHRGELSDSLRQAVLDRNGVSEGDLLHFADVRGTDIAFMRDIWAEVERRLEERRVPLDSISGSDP